MEDRCDGTLTTVKRGKVAVRDFRLKKTIVVTAGKSYLADARVEPHRWQTRRSRVPSTEPSWPFC